MNKLIIINDMTNREFLETHASPGRVGLVGASHFIDRPIKRAQRSVRADRLSSQWSHAFLFEGRRIDDEHWVIESDLDINGRHVRFGVQENRIEKYFDELAYPTIAILDFGLTPAQTTAMLRAALGMLADHFEYSIRELVGTLVALPSRRLRARPNLLQKERSFYCSAFVQHLFMQIGLDFAPDTDTKHTSPEHISLTTLPHTAYLLRRE